MAENHVEELPTGEINSPPLEPEDNDEIFTELGFSDDVQTAKTELSRSVSCGSILQGNGLSKLRNLSRRVSFPSDDKLISGYNEPKNPWEHAHNTTTEDLIQAYTQACQAWNVRPITKLLLQLQEIKDFTVRANSLTLKGEKLEMRVVETLESIFKRVQFVTIDLEATNLDEDAGASLFDMIEYYESGVNVLVGFNKNLGNRGWQAAAHMMRKMSCLRLFDGHSVPVSIQASPFVGRALRLSNTLVTLHLENAMLSGRPLLLIVAALRMNTTLRELFLADNRFSPLDALQIANLLKFNRILQLLDLRNNPIQDMGLGHLCAGLMAQSGSSGLNGPIGGLQTLVLWNNQISLEGMPKLAMALRYTISLSTLNLGQNVLGDDGILRLKEGLLQNHSLLRLGLVGTKLTDEGAVAIAEYLAESPRIIRLDLRNNDIKVAGLMALSLAFKINNSLLRLDIDKPNKKDALKELAAKQESLMCDIVSYAARNKQAALEKAQAVQMRQEEARRAHMKESSELRYMDMTNSSSSTSTDTSGTSANNSNNQSPDRNFTVLSRKGATNHVAEPRAPVPNSINTDTDDTPEDSPEFLPRSSVSYHQVAPVMLSNSEMAKRAAAAKLAPVSERHEQESPPNERRFLNGAASKITDDIFSGAKQDLANQASHKPMKGQSSTREISDQYSEEYTQANHREDVHTPTSPSTNGGSVCNGVLETPTDAGLDADSLNLPSEAYTSKPPDTNTPKPASPLSTDNAFVNEMPGQPTDTNASLGIDTHGIESHSDMSEPVNQLTQASDAVEMGEKPTSCAVQLNADIDTNTSCGLCTDSLDTPSPADISKPAEESCRPGEAAEMVGTLTTLAEAIIGNSTVSRKPKTANYKSARSNVDVSEPVQEFPPHCNVAKMGESLNTLAEAITGFATVSQRPNRDVLSCADGEEYTQPIGAATIQENHNTCAVNLTEDAIPATATQKSNVTTLTTKDPMEDTSPNMEGCVPTYEASIDTTVVNCGSSSLNAGPSVSREKLPAGFNEDAISDQTSTSDEVGPSVVRAGKTTQHDLHKEKCVNASESGYDKEKADASTSCGVEPRVNGELFQHGLQEGYPHVKVSPETSHTSTSDVEPRAVESVVAEHGSGDHGRLSSDVDDVKATKVFEAFDSMSEYQGTHFEEQIEENNHGIHEPTIEPVPPRYPSNTVMDCETRETSNTHNPTDDDSPEDVAIQHLVAMATAPAPCSVSKSQSDDAATDQSEENYDDSPPDGAMCHIVAMGTPTTNQSPENDDAISNHVVMEMAATDPSPDDDDDSPPDGAESHLVATGTVTPQRTTLISDDPHTDQSSGFETATEDNSITSGDLSPMDDQLGGKNIVNDMGLLTPDSGVVHFENGNSKESPACDENGSQPPAEDCASRMNEKTSECVAQVEKFHNILTPDSGVVHFENGAEKESPACDENGSQPPAEGCASRMNEKTSECVAQVKKFHNDIAESVHSPKDCNGIREVQQGFIFSETEKTTCEGAENHIFYEHQISLEKMSKKLSKSCEMSESENLENGSKVSEISPCFVEISHYDLNKFSPGE